MGNSVTRYWPLNQISKVLGQEQFPLHESMFFIYELFANFYKVGGEIKASVLVLAELMSLPSPPGRPEIKNSSGKNIGASGVGVAD